MHRQNYNITHKALHLEQIPSQVGQKKMAWLTIVFVTHFNLLRLTQPIFSLKLQSKDFEAK